MKLWKLVITEKERKIIRSVMSNGISHTIAEKLAPSKLEEVKPQVNAQCGLCKRYGVRGMCRHHRLAGSLLIEIEE